jgi:hypothetical protein
MRFKKLDLHAGLVAMPEVVVIENCRIRAVGTIEEGIKASGFQRFLRFNRASASANPGECL